MSSNQEFANAAPGAEGYRKDHPAAAHCQIIDADKGEIDLMGRKKIAICGFASSTRHYFPVDNPEWIVVGLNQIYRHSPRFDVHFDIHSYWEEDNVDGTDHPKWIRECGIPVFMAERYAESPTSVRYPIERLIAKYGLDYFTSTVSFELAWAIDYIEQQVTKRLEGESVTPATMRALFSEYTIGIYGIDLIVGTEYEVQKACVEFYVGMATALGITMHIPPECALLKQMYRYGYQREADTGLMKLSELSDRHAEIERTKQVLFKKMHEHNGALGLLKDLKTKLNGDSGPILDAQIGVLMPELEKTVAELQTYDGAQQESAHMRAVLELRLRGGKIPLCQGKT